MDRFELNSSFSPEQVWGRLTRNSEKTIRGRTETRYFEIKLKPGKKYRFNAVLDLWLLPAPDEFGRLPSNKPMKHEARQCFRGKIEPQETGSRLVGNFHVGRRTLALYLLVVGCNLLKHPEYMKGWNLLLFAAIAVLVAAAVYAVQNWYHKEDKTAQRQWLMRYLDRLLLRP